jgi:hypothetical protein
VVQSQRQYAVLRVCLRITGFPSLALLLTDVSRHPSLTNPEHPHNSRPPQPRILLPCLRQHVSKNFQYNARTPKHIPHLSAQRIPHLHHIPKPHQVHPRPQHDRANLQYRIASVFNELDILHLEHLFVLRTVQHDTKSYRIPSMNRQPKSCPATPRFTIPSPY